jgi:hypothetical protein
VLLVLVAVSLLAAQQAAPLPARPDSLKFAVIGDTGTGDTPEYEVGTRMSEARSTFPFEMVIMLGDNLYGRQNPQDFVTKFQRPYQSLLTAGVLFYASLGNHDNPANRLYPNFNMGGERYYTYTKKNVQFFALDSNAMDPQQLAWLDNALKQSVEAWKICYFHHPLYSDGKFHGPDADLRARLEPILLKSGVKIVLSGHEHLYERLQPQKGINYFILGNSGQLRIHDIRPSSTMAKGFDKDQCFMLIEVAGDECYFQTITRRGDTADSGVIQ